MGKVFSVVMPYHSAPNMFRAHTRATWEIPVSQSDLIEYIVCDDASPVPIQAPIGHCTQLRLYRISPPHIRWSHRCATNVAASHAAGEWLLVTDIDHVVPPETWSALFARYRDGELDPGEVYNFRRRNVDGSTKNPHPDSWLIHRAMWDRIGGYDTRYRGHYGQNSAFQDRVKHHAGDTITLYEHLIRYAREDIADASMPDVPGMRKSDEDREAVGRMRAQFKADGTYWLPGEIVAHEKVYP